MKKMGEGGREGEEGKQGKDGRGEEGQIEVSGGTWADGRWRSLLLRLDGIGGAGYNVERGRSA